MFCKIDTADRPECHSGSQTQIFEAYLERLQQLQMERGNLQEERTKTNVDISAEPRNPVNEVTAKDETPIYDLRKQNSWHSHHRTGRGSEGVLMGMGKN